MPEADSDSNGTWIRINVLRINDLRSTLTSIRVIELYINNTEYASETQGLPSSEIEIMLLIIGRRAGVFVRNTLRPSVLGLTECHSWLSPFTFSRWGRGWGRLLSQGDRVRRGVGPAVGDGDQDVGDSALASDLLGNAAHHDLRLSRLAGPHLDVGPGDARAPAGAHGLEDRLLGRPPAREVLDRVLPRLAIANLPGRVNPPQEQLAVLLDHLADPRAFDDVAADSQDLHAQRPSHENGSPAEFASISVYWAPETWPSWKTGEGWEGVERIQCRKGTERLPYLTVADHTPARFWSSFESRSMLPRDRHFPPL